LGNTSVRPCIST